jgi:hypothetical protein
MLNPNLKMKICHHLTFFGTSVCVLLRFQLFVLYFTRIYICVTGSDDLKLLSHIEMNIRNSKIAVRMLYGKKKKLHALTQ